MRGGNDVYIPVIVDITDDGYCSLLDECGSCREDLQLPLIPTDLSTRIRQKHTAGEQVVVAVTQALEYEQIVSFKTEDRTS